MIYLIIYLSGLVPGYFLFKKYMISGGSNWTVGLRWIGLFASVFSWVGVVTSLLCLGAKSDKPASW